MSETKEIYSRRDWCLLFIKGIAMGAADVVPGVSGGTIAFISGIYQRLLDALKSLTPVALMVLLQQGFSAFWSHIDGRFLLTLFAGILLSVFSLATIISNAIEHYPIFVWSFFFGLVVASVIYLFQQTPHWRWQEWLAIVLGTLLALAIVSARPAQLPGEWWMLLLAGSVAICAMILPGISGSFLLLLMGMYPVVLGALKEFNLLLLASFGTGCIIGLLGFSHLLSWLLRRYESVMYSVLMGFLVGSLKVLWPWKQVLETTVDRHGEIIPLVQANVLPWQFTEITGQSAYFLPALLCALFGLVLVLLLERIAKKP